MGLWKYWNFQSEVKVEQIIAVVATHSVSCFWVNLETAYIGQCISLTDITILDRLCVTIRVLLCILKVFLFSLGIFLPWASFNPIQDGHFRGCSRMGGGGTKRRLFPKICHRYSTMMKLGTVIPYLKKIKKMYESRDTPFEFCWHKHFLTGNQQILLYTDIDCILIHDFWVFKYFFNKPGYNFDDVSKNSYPRPS